MFGVDPVYDFCVRREACAAEVARGNLELFKEAVSRFEPLEQFSLNFSSSPFVVRVGFPFLNHFIPLLLIIISFAFFYLSIKTTIFVQNNLTQDIVTELRLI